jgi:hypothetical protein
VANPATATALGSQKIASVPIGGDAVTATGNIEISVAVNNSGVSTAFNMSEIGIFGTSGGGPEQLLIYISDSTPATLPPISSGLLNIYLYFGIAVSNTSNVNVTVATGVYALQSQFVTHLADPAAHPQAFLNPINLATGSQQGLIVQSTGTGLKVLSDTPTPSWVNALLTITANATLYVSTTGNDSTGAFNDPTHPFATAQGALNRLSNYFIFPGVSVTISIANGTYNSSTPITVSHPQGSQISIIATATPSSINITGASYASGDTTLTGASGALVCLAFKLDTTAGSRICNI